MIASSDNAVNRETVCDVLRAHLPVNLREGGVMCLHNSELHGESLFDGPVFYREHVVDAIYLARSALAGWTPPGGEEAK